MPSPGFEHAIPVIEHLRWRGHRDGRSLLSMTNLIEIGTRDLDMKRARERKPEFISHTAHNIHEFKWLMKRPGLKNVVLCGDKSNNLLKPNGYIKHQEV